MLDPHAIHSLQNYIYLSPDNFNCVMYITESVSVYETPIILIWNRRKNKPLLLLLFLKSRPICYLIMSYILVRRF